MLKRLLVVAMAAMALPAPASAGPAADLLRDGLYSGSLDAAGGALKPLADAGDQEARFSLGLVTFVSALETVSQAFYRHGATAPDGGPMAAGILGAPVPMPPVPANPNPTPIDYAKFRAELEAFVARLDDAADVLQEAGESGDYVVPVEVLKIRIDVNGDGIAEEHESIGTVIAGVLGVGPAELTGTAPVQPPSGNRTQSGAFHTPPAAEVSDSEIGFDRADAIWLAGYSNVIAAQADFLLAHDFSDLFNATFHRVFPLAGLPMQEFSRGGSLALDPETDSAIADAIALIHTLNWPVIDRERMLRVLERGKTVTALSRKNWDAILAETDDNRELLPNPNQTPFALDGKITDEMVAAWRSTLDTLDQILDGKLLIPHWRFKQGVDLKAYFETAERTDFVMLLTGYGALPFLRDGPIADANSFADANRVFGDNLLGFAVWFN